MAESNTAPATVANCYAECQLDYFVIAPLAVQDLVLFVPIPLVFSDLWREKKTKKKLIVQFIFYHNRNGNAK